MKTTMQHLKQKP